MMIEFPVMCATLYENKEAAIRGVERAAAQPRDRWQLAEIPTFNDDTRLWQVAHRDFDDAPDTVNFYEMYDNPHDDYLYLIVTWRRGGKIVEQACEKYVWRR